MSAHLHCPKCGQEYTEFDEYLNNVIENPDKVCFRCNIKKAENQGIQQIEAMHSN